MPTAAMVAALLALALVRSAPALGAGHSLVALDLDTGATRTLARSRLGWEALRPTPDGRSLLAIREDSSGPGRRVTRVRRRIDLLSGRQTRLPGVHEGGGSFSPDGTRVFVQTGRTDVGEMVLRTIAGRPLVRLRPRSGGGFMGATWSADSRLLAVEDPLDADPLEGRNIHFRVRLVDARTGRILGARNVTGEPVLGPQSFAPGGDRLVMSDLPSTGAVFDGFTAILDLRTGALARIAPEHGGFTLPAWSPDGRRIALRRGSGGVAVLDAATGATERVIATPDAIADGPSWSPDGTRLAYALVPPELFCLACFFSPDGPPSSLRTESGLAVADVTTGAARVIVAPGTRNVREAVWTRDGRGLIADVEDVRRAGRPAAPRRDRGAGAGSRARAAGAARRAARS